LTDVYRALRSARKRSTPDRQAIEALVVKAPGARLTDVQIECLHEARAAGGLVASAGVGTGKGQRPTDRVLTPDGWLLFSDLKVGQRIIGADGKAVKVTGVYPRGALPTYTVTFNDGASLVVDGDHLWNVRSVHDADRHRPWRTIATRDLAGRVRGPGGRRVWRIPLVSPIAFPKKVLPFDPYLLGVLLGDGSISHGSVSFCCGDEETAIEVSKVLPSGVTLNKRGSNKKVPRWSLTGGYKNNLLLTSLRSLGLQGTRSHTRFIPDVFLFSDVDDRLSLLQGLMDTDGEISSTSAMFASSSLRLADDVAFLVESLGGTARRSVRKEPKYRLHGKVLVGRPSYRVTVALPFPLVGARALAHRWPKRPKYPPVRMLESITPSEPSDIICISVGAPDALYVTERCIVTHNSLVTLLLATVLEATKPLLIVKKNLVRNLALEHEKWAPYFHIRPYRILTYDALSDPRNALALHNLDIDLLVADEAHLLKHARSARTNRVIKKVVQHLPKVAILTGTLTTRDCSDYSHLAEAALRDNSPIPTFDDTACLAWKRVLGARPDPEDHDWTYVRHLCDAYKRPTTVEGGREALQEHLRTTRGFVLTTESSCRSSLIMERIRTPPLPPHIHAVIKSVVLDQVDPEGQPRTIYEVDTIGRQLLFGFWYKTTTTSPPDLVDKWRRAANTMGAVLRSWLGDGGAQGIDSPSLTRQAIREGKLGQFAFQANDEWEAVQHLVEWKREVVWLWPEWVEAQIAWLRKHPEPAILWFRHQAIGDEIAKHFPVYARNASPDLKAHKCGMSITAMHQGHNLQSWAHQRVAQPPAEAGVWQQLLGRTHRLGQEADEVFCEVVTHSPRLAKTLDSALDAAEYVEATTGERQRLKLATWIQS
jgi:hypothetical protein